MLWAGIIAGGTGLMLSVRYRVAAVVPAGLLGAVLVLCASAFTQWTALTTLATVAIVLCALNAGYLSGFALSCAWAHFAVKEHAAAFPSPRSAQAEASLPDLHR